MKTSDPAFQALHQSARSSLPTFDHEQRVASNRLKTFFKRWPGLYLFLRETFGPTHSPLNGFQLRRRVAELFRECGPNAVVLNLGSGATRVHPDIINVDIFPFQGVDVRASMSDLPLRDQCVDGVVCDSVLEHLDDTQGSLAEVHRVLKPGGLFFVTSLFLYPFHSSPSDYFRWTEQGIRLTLERHGFEIQELGIRGGPMGALQASLMHIVALPFARVSQGIYFLVVQVCMVLFSPLKLLDIVFFSMPEAREAASDLYVIARKK